MDTSPAGHEIRRITGDAAEITARGTEMESLGTQMREAAALLKRMKDGVQGKGYSVDSIVDAAGDVHKDLGRAGERYEPSGTVMRRYGETLSRVQTTTDRVVSECETLWHTYETKKGAAGDLASKPAPDGETPAEKTTRENGVQDAQGDATAAYHDWADEARRYDAPYDDWDAAYDAAYHGLKDANDDGVHDSWLDNMLPGIEIALEILKWAGLVLAVAALVIGGPIVALIAAAVGIAALVLTIMKVSAGRGGASDIVMAVIGVLPFGKLGVLGKLFKGEKLGAVLGKLAKGGLEDMTGVSAVRQIRAIRGMPGRISALNPLNRAGNLRGMAGTRAQLTQAAQGWRNQVRVLGRSSYMTPRQIGYRFINGKTASLEQDAGALVSSTFKSNQARLAQTLKDAGIESWAKGGTKSGFEQAVNVSSNSYSLYRNEQKITGMVDSHDSAQATQAQQNQWATQLARP